MSLMQRVERAQKGAAEQPPSENVPVPVMAPHGAREEQPGPRGAAARGPDPPADRDRQRLQRPARRSARRRFASASRASSTASSTRHDFAVTREERAGSIEEMVHDVTGFGPLEPLLADESITEVMVNGPSHIYIERARQDRADRQRLPQRRARAPRDRPDHRPARPADRRVEPARRRPPARRLSRQRDHRAAVARRARSSPSGSSRPSRTRSTTSSGSERRRPRCSTSSRRASRPV